MHPLLHSRVRSWSLRARLRNEQVKKKKKVKAALNYQHSRGVARPRACIFQRPGCTGDRSLRECAADVTVNALLVQRLHSITLAFCIIINLGDGEKPLAYSRRRIDRMSGECLSIYGFP